MSASTSDGDALHIPHMRVHCGLFKAPEILAGYHDVASTMLAPKFSVAPQPTNGFFSMGTARADDTNFAAIVCLGLYHEVTRMPAPRAATANARLAFSAGFLPALASEHAWSAARCLSPRLPGQFLSRNSVQDWMASMLVCPPAGSVRTVIGMLNFWLCIPAC